MNFCIVDLYTHKWGVGGLDQMVPPTCSPPSIPPPPPKRSPHPLRTLSGSTLNNLSCLTIVTSDFRAIDLKELMPLRASACAKIENFEPFVDFRGSSLHNPCNSCPHLRCPRLHPDQANLSCSCQCAHIFSPACLLPSSVREIAFN